MCFLEKKSSIIFSELESCHLNSILRLHNEIRWKVDRSAKPCSRLVINFPLSRSFSFYAVNYKNFVKYLILTQM